jgi:aquaporin Z
MEAWGLGMFMISAGVFTTLLEFPDSPAREAIPDPVPRRVLIGLAMGLTAIGIIYSPWGQRSGAHINPSVTLTFLRLGKIAPWDAVFYIIAQFIGGTAGMVVVAMALRAMFAQPVVEYVVTIPGPAGAGVAFAAELVISLGLMLMILLLSNTDRLTRFTGIVAGLLVATYITVEAPLSGMSMNPARTFASAAPSGIWTGVWVYFTAPILGMLAAGEISRLAHDAQVGCPKLHRSPHHRCIHCGYDPATSTRFPCADRRPRSASTNVAAEKSMPPPTTEEPR